MAQLPSAALLEARAFPAIADVEKIHSLARRIQRPELARAVAAVVEGVRLVLDRPHEERVQAPGVALDPRQPAVERLRHVGPPAPADETLRAVGQQLAAALEQETVEAKLGVALQHLDPGLVDRALLGHALGPGADQLAVEAQVRAGPYVRRRHDAQPAVAVIGHLAPPGVAVGLVAQARLHAESRGRCFARDCRRAQGRERQESG